MVAIEPLVCEFVFKMGSCKTQVAVLQFSLFRPGWPQTSGGPPTSVPQELELLTHLKLMWITDLNHKEIAKFTIQNKGFSLVGHLSSHCELSL